jgi:hypothetical protein
VSVKPALRCQISTHFVRFDNSSHANVVSKLPHSNSSSSIPALYTASPLLKSRISTASSTLPPVGYALAQLLPGKTIRLTINTPSAVRWLPGQHVTLTIPSVKLLQGHPYTILSVDEHGQGIEPLFVGSNSTASPIVLLIRAQKGFSKSLWDVVVRKRSEQERNSSTMTAIAGVNLRAYISWPTGSSARDNWGLYSTIVIAVGGTGCSFGLSILEYACRRMARRDAMARVGRKIDKAEGIAFQTTRVRFVWTLRDYCKSLRRFFTMSY